MHRSFAHRDTPAACQLIDVARRGMGEGPRQQRPFSNDSSSGAGKTGHQPDHSDRSVDHAAVSSTTPRGSTQKETPNRGSKPIRPVYGLARSRVPPSQARLQPSGAWHAACQKRTPLAHRCGGSTGIEKQARDRVSEAHGSTASLKPRNSAVAHLLSAPGFPFNLDRESGHRHPIRLLPACAHGKRTGNARMLTPDAHCQNASAY
jgi:hypothetical protein